MHLKTLAFIIIYIILYSIFSNMIIYGKPIRKKINNGPKLGNNMQLIVKGDIRKALDLTKNETMGVKLNKFKRFVNKQYPEYNLPIYLTPEAAIHKSSSINCYDDYDADEDFTIAEAIDYFCLKSGLTFKFSQDKILITLSKFENAEENEVKDIGKEVQYKIIRVKKLDKEPLIIYIMSENSFEVECDKHLFKNLPKLMSYLKSKKIDTSKTCIVLYGTKVQNKYEDLVFDALSIFSKSKGIDFFSKICSSRKISYRYKKYIWKTSDSKRSEKSPK